jgi:hypothetical protein
VSIWDDKRGRKHVGVMVNGKRVHRVLPDGATASDAKLVEAEIRAAVARQPKRIHIPGDPPMLMIIDMYVSTAKRFVAPKRQSSTLAVLGVGLRSTRPAKHRSSPITSFGMREASTPTRQLTARWRAPRRG